MKTKLLLTLAAGLALAGLSGCLAGPAVANAITAASETAAGNALQKKALTLPQLNQRATDLGGLPNTPLTPADNALVASLVAQLVNQKATLTSASAIDGVNNAISALTAAGSPTAAEGIAWADLQDVVLGLKAEVKFATANPQLLPSP